MKTLRRRGLARHVAVMAGFIALAMGGMARAQDAYVFSTLAGAAGIAGSLDRYAQLARFNEPMGVAVDNTGTVYVADYRNGTVRKIVDGSVTTYIGKVGEFGSVDGTPEQARFGPKSSGLYVPAGGVGPSAVALDRNGDLYIFDPSNNRVAKLQNGMVRTLTPRSSGAFWQGTYPVYDEKSIGLSMCVHDDGMVSVGFRHEVYLSERLNSFEGVIVHRPPEMDDITLSGIGLGSPTVIAAGPQGSVFVIDAASLTLVSIDPAGSKRLLAGTNGRAGSSDGVGPAASFGGVPAVPAQNPGTGPLGMACASNGNLFVCDTQNHTIRRVTPVGEVTTVGGLAGSAGSWDGIGGEARFSRPSGIAVDSAGRLYIADTANHTIRIGTPAYRPRFSVQPQNADVQVGQGFTLSATMAANVFPEQYQWEKNGVAIVGATATTLSVPKAASADFGSYTLVATNEIGRTTSAVAMVGIPARIPAVTTQPKSTTLALGDLLTLTIAAAADPAPTIQWLKDGQPIAGATTATLTISGIQPTDGGSYTAVVTNSAGSMTSDAAVVVVNWSRIVNVSIRTGITTAAPMVTVGFVVGGGSKPLLVRTVGPTLKPFGVGDAISDPKLALFKGDTQMAANDNWSSATNASDIATAARQVGAFALASGAADAALLTTLNGSAYTVQATGVAGATGTALVEVYDADATNGGRLVNVSSRAQVGTGDNVLVAGFAVNGTAKKTLLIRAVGPTLASFGVAGTLSDPKIELIPAGATAAIASNDNWAGDPALVAAFASVGAFSFTNGQSKDAALIVTVSPGSYSAKVSGVGGAIGETLVEIYELP